MVEQPSPASSPAPLTDPGWFTKIDRKTWSAGAAGVLTWLLLAGCSSWLHFDLAAWMQPFVTAFAAAFGIAPAPSAQGFLAIAIGFLISYALPPAWKDIYSRINNRIIARAVVDPVHPTVTVPAIAAAVKVAELEKAP